MAGGRNRSTSLRDSAIFPANAKVGFSRSEMALASGVGSYRLQCCQLVSAYPPPCSTATDTGLMGVTSASLEPSGRLAVLSGTQGVRDYSGMQNSLVSLNGAPPGAPQAVHAADVNGDRATDVTVVAVDGSATVLAGKEGAFAVDAALSAEISDKLKQAGALSVLALGDVDGLPDLALSVKATPKEVRVAFNQGDGKFEAPRALATSATSWALYGSLGLAA